MFKGQKSIISYQEDCKNVGIQPSALHITQSSKLHALWSAIWQLYFINFCAKNLGFQKKLGLDKNGNPSFMKNPT